MGFVIVMVLGLYVLISIGVVAWSVNYAKKHNKSTKRWGGGAALGMYLLVFWDWIPTVITHEYYCATEAGFWVYKTPEQWMKENPGVRETLKVLRSIQSTPYGDLQTLNERFAIETHRSKPIFFLPTQIAERLLVDRKTGEVLAKGVDIGSGVGHIATGGGIKFWLNQKPCITHDIWDFSKELQNLKGIK